MYISFMIHAPYYYYIGYDSFINHITVSRLVSWPKDVLET